MYIYKLRLKITERSRADEFLPRYFTKPVAVSMADAILVATRGGLLFTSLFTTFYRVTKFSQRIDLGSVGN